MSQFLKTNDFVKTTLAEEMADEITTLATLAPGAGDLIMPAVLPYIITVTDSESYAGFYNSEQMLVYDRDGDDLTVCRDWNQYIEYDGPNTTADGAAVTGAGTIDVASAADMEAYNYFRIGYSPILYRIVSIATNTLTIEPPLQNDVDNGATIRVMADHKRDGGGDPISHARPHAVPEKVFVLVVQSYLEELQDAVSQLQDLALPDDITADTVTLVNHILVGDKKVGFADATGMIKYAAGHFQGYNATEWVNLDEAGGVGDTLPPGTEGEIMAYIGDEWVSTPIITIVPDTSITLTVGTGTLVLEETLATFSEDVVSGRMRALSFCIQDPINEFADLQDGFNMFKIDMCGTIVSGLAHFVGGEFTPGPVWLMSGVEVPVLATDIAMALNAVGQLNIGSTETAIPDSSRILISANNVFIGDVTEWVFDLTNQIATFAHPLTLPLFTVTTGSWEVVADYPVAPTDGMLIYHSADGFQAYQAGNWWPIIGDGTPVLSPPGTAWATIHYDATVGVEDWVANTQLLVEPLQVIVANSILIGPADPETAETPGRIEYVNGDFEGIVEGPDGDGTIRVSLTNISPEQRLPGTGNITGGMMYSKEVSDRWRWFSTGVQLWDEDNSRLMPATIKIGDGAGDAGLIRWSSDYDRLEWTPNGTSWYSLTQEANMPLATTLGSFMIVGAGPVWEETTVLQIVDGEVKADTIEVSLLRLIGIDPENTIELTVDSFSIPNIVTHSIIMETNDDGEPTLDCSEGSGTFLTLTVGSLTVTNLTVLNEEEEGISLTLDRLSLQDVTGGSPLFVLEPSPTNMSLLYQNLIPMVTFRQNVTDTFEGTITGDYDIGDDDVIVAGLDDVIEVGSTIVINDVAHEITNATGTPTTHIYFTPALTEAVTDGTDFVVNYGGMETTVNGDLIVERDLTVGRIATFAYTIKLNDASDDDGEVNGMIDEPGMIRYNGDFQGRLSNGQWASFTRGMAAGTIDDYDFGSLLYWNSSQWTKNVNVRVHADGGLRLGSSSISPYAGAIRFTGTDFEGCIYDGTWVTLTALEDLPSLPTGGDNEGATLYWHNGDWVVNPQLASDGVTTFTPMLQLAPYENFYAAGITNEAKLTDDNEIDVMSSAELFVDDVVVFDNYPLNEYTITAVTDLGGGDYNIVFTPALLADVPNNTRMRIVGSMYHIGEGLLARPEPQGGQLRYNQNDYQGFVEGIGWVTFTGHRSWLPNREGDPYLEEGNILYFHNGTWVAHHATRMTENALNGVMDINLSGNIDLTGYIHTNGIKLGQPPLSQWDVETGLPVAIPGFMYFDITSARFKGCVRKEPDGDSPAWVDIISPIQPTIPLAAGQTLLYNAETDYWNNTNLLLLSHEDHVDFAFFGLDLSIRGFEIVVAEMTLEGEGDNPDAIYYRTEVEMNSPVDDTMTRFMTLQSGVTGATAVEPTLRVNVENFLARRFVINPSMVLDFDGDIDPIGRNANINVYSFVNTGKSRFSDEVDMFGELTLSGANLTVAGGEITVTVGDFTLTEGSVFTDNLTATGYGYFDKQIRVGYVATDPEFEPGIIRYSFPENAGRGDFEGWDGTQWVSFTAGFHGEAIWIVDGFPAATGDLVVYDEDFQGGKFRCYKGMSIDITTDTLTAGIFHAVNAIDIEIDAPDPEIGRIKFTGTDLQFSVDGSTWVSMIGYGDSGLPSAFDAGSLVRWYETETTLFSTFVEVSGGDYGSTMVVVDNSAVPVIGMFLEYTSGLFYKIIDVVDLGTTYELHLDQPLSDVTTPLSPLNVYNSSADWVVTNAIRITGDRIHLDSVIQLKPYEDMDPITEPTGGQIRYNETDYQGFIPTIGWVSFTGHLPFQLPADHTGEFLYSNGDFWVGADDLVKDGIDYTIGSGAGATLTLAFDDINCSGSIVTAKAFQPTTALPGTPAAGMIAWSTDKVVTYVGAAWLPITTGLNNVDATSAKNFPVTYYDIANNTFKGSDLLWLDDDLTGVEVERINIGNRITFTELSGDTGWEMILGGAALKWQYGHTPLMQINATQFSLEVELIAGDAATFSGAFTVSDFVGAFESGIDAWSGVVTIDETLSTFRHAVTIGETGTPQDLTVWGSLYVKEGLYNTYGTVLARETRSIGFVGMGNDNTANAWFGVVRYTGSMTCKANAAAVTTDTTVVIKNLTGTAPTTVAAEGRMIVDGDPSTIYQITTATDLTGGVWELEIDPPLAIDVDEDTEIRLLKEGDYEGWNGTQWVSFTNYSNGGGGGGMDYIAGSEEGQLLRWNNATEEWELSTDITVNGPGAYTFSVDSGNAYFNNEIHVNTGVVTAALATDYIFSSSIDPILVVAGPILEVGSSAAQIISLFTSAGDVSGWGNFNITNDMCFASYKTVEAAQIVFQVNSTDIESVNPHYNIVMLDVNTPGSRSIDPGEYAYGIRVQSWIDYAEATATATYTVGLAAGSTLRLTNIAEPIVQSGDSLVGYQLLHISTGEYYTIATSAYISSETWDVTLTTALAQTIPNGHTLHMRGSETNLGIKSEMPIVVQNNRQQAFQIRAYNSPTYKAKTTAFSAVMDSEESTYVVTGYEAMISPPATGEEATQLNGVYVKLSNDTDAGKDGTIREVTYFRGSQHSTEGNYYGKINTMYGLRLLGFDQIGWNTVTTSEMTGIQIGGYPGSGYIPIHDGDPAQRIDNMTGIAILPMYSYTENNNVYGIRLYGPIGHEDYTDTMYGLWIGSPLSVEAGHYSSAGGLGVKLGNYGYGIKVEGLINGLATTMGHNSDVLSYTGTSSEIVKQDKQYAIYTEEGRVHFGGDMRAESIGVNPTGVMATKPTTGYYRKGDIWIYSDGSAPLNSGTLVAGGLYTYICLRSGYYNASIAGTHKNYENYLVSTNAYWGIQSRGWIAGSL